MRWTSVPYSIPLPEISSQPSGHPFPSSSVKSNISWTPNLDILLEYPGRTGLAMLSLVFLSELRSIFGIVVCPSERSVMKKDGLGPEITVMYCLALDRATNIRRLSSL